MEQVDTAVARVLRLKQRLGLFADPYHGADQAKAEALFLCPEHRRVVRKAAEESAVLLKNDGLLPLPEYLTRVALIGPFADEHGINGFWSCCGRDEDTVTMAQGIRALLPAFPRRWKPQRMPRRSSCVWENPRPIPARATAARTSGCRECSWSWQKKC